MRLQKYLADAGVASRRKCEEIIAQGRVTVNGNIAVIGCSVDDCDVVMLDGKPIELVSERVVFAFYKPKNVICSNAEKEDRIKVTDYFKNVPFRLYTVGRLDFDSEGLIFVTNDGDFAEKMSHPRYQKSKVYRVLCSGVVTEEELDVLRSGVLLEDGITAPAKVEIIKRFSRKTELLLTIHEGRNRQVRRMLAAVGHDTLKLCRIKIGDISLGTLSPGEYRKLSEAEVYNALK